MFNDLDEKCSAHPLEEDLRVVINNEFILFCFLNFSTNITRTNIFDSGPDQHNTNLGFLPFSRFGRKLT